MKNVVTIGAFVSVLLAPALGYAHPQHADANFVSGFTHPLVGFDHLLAMLAVGIWAARMGGRATWAVPSAFLAALTAGWLCGQAGITAPAVEPMIAASVLVLGLCVLLDVHAGAILGAGLVAAFAFVHGLAHVENVHTGAVLGAYWAGFMLVTALLHLLGMSVARVLRRRAEILHVAAAPIAFAGAWLLIVRLGLS